MIVKRKKRWRRKLEHRRGSNSTDFETKSIIRGDVKRQRSRKKRGRRENHT
jgi:hypothetical protein